MAPSLKPITTVVALVVTTARASTPLPTIRYCNRGYCYTRKEPENHHGLNVEIIPLTKKLQSNSKPKNPGSRGGLDFCTDSHGQLMDCELFEILSMDQDEIDIQYESVETVGKDESAPPCGAGDEADSRFSRTGEFTEFSEDWFDEVIELDSEEQAEKRHGRVPLKERPKKGKCRDSDLGYSFDCNLVDILDEGLVLIEDLRAGGVFAAQPKSGFTTRRRQIDPITTPTVLKGSEPCDPNEDMRTQVMLNLEGL